MSRPIDPVEARDQMVDQQIVARGITDARVIEAMRWLPREKFFPDEIRSHAFDDAAAAVGCGQTISQPYIVALMTQTLDIKPTHTILEVGTGTGYQAAILGRLGGEVYTVERHKMLLDEAFERLLSLHVRNVHFCFGDGSLGWPTKAPYDRIILTAASPAIDERVLRQLNDGGICIAPVGPRDEQRLIKFTREGDAFKRTDLGGVKFVPMIGEGGFES